MSRKIAGLVATLLVVGSLVGGAVAADKAALDKAFANLPQHDWGKSREALNAIDAVIVESYGKAADRKDIETRLIAVLKGQATRAAKQYVCRKLAVMGTSASVDALATLLTDEKLSHMGRYALERMACDAAAKALRDAAGKAQGKLRIGMINSLGARQDAGAVNMLIALLKNPDAAVSTAAAAALGRIGEESAAAALAEFLDKAPKKLKNAAVDANLDFAQRIAAKGNKAAAGKIYDKLYAKDQPGRIRRAALQGLAMVRPAQTAPLIMEALGSADATFRGLAASMIREMPGAEATKTFAAALGKLPEAGQVALLDALADRKDPAARPAVLKATESKTAAVAAAGIRALGAVGGASDVALLAKTAVGTDETAKAATTSLARLRGEDVNKTIVEALGSADAKTKVVLVKALASRAAAECAPAVTKCAGDADADVSRAGIEALGALGDQKQIPDLIAMLKAGKDAGSVDRALTAICSRVKDKATGDLVTGLKGANSDAQRVLLNALGRCGDAKALETVLAATKSAEEKVADAGIRVLCNWAGQAAIDPLLAIAASTKNDTHQVLAVRGVVRLARMRETPGNVRWKALSEAMKHAKKTGEKKQVLGALRDVQTLDALKLVSKYVGEKALAEEAGAAAVRIANRVWNKDKELARKTLLTVADTVRSRRTKSDAQKLLGKIGPKPK